MEHTGVNCPFKQRRVIRMCSAMRIKQKNILVKTLSIKNTWKTLWWKSIWALLQMGKHINIYAFQRNWSCPGSTTPASHFHHSALNLFSFMSLLSCFCSYLLINVWSFGETYTFDDSQGNVHTRDIIYPVFNILHTRHDMRRTGTASASWCSL